MPAMSLEEILKSNLDVVNREFQEADKGLHAEMNATSSAVAKISGGVAQLVLVVATEGEEGIMYALMLDAKGTGRWNLGFFGVSRRGFPIIFGPSSNELTAATGKAIEDPAQLKALFHEMASNPDSPLIQKVAYAMRKSKG